MQYVEGFLGGMRAYEFCPNEFKCFTYANILQDVLAELDFKFQIQGIPYVIEAIKALIRAYRIAIPECETSA